MKLDFIMWFIAALACYRVSILISRCLGPWDVFKKLRSIDRCSKLLKCVFCVSIYVGGFTVVALYFPKYAMPVLVALSFSSVTIILDRCFTSDHNPQ